jgi:glycosyltransferase involved in cell wall biosynthesis
MLQVDFTSKKCEMKGQTIAILMTSDFEFDQRMQRIADTLSKHHRILIYHRGNKNLVCNTLQVRSMNSVIKKGWMFYLAYNVRLFMSLLWQQMDIVYCVDADTLLAGGLVSKLRHKIMVYDSHEWFTEVPELSGRSRVKKIWSIIENTFVPQAQIRITVNESLASIFTEKWGKEFVAIRNLPKRKIKSEVKNPEQVLIYQGAVNAGRGLECAIQALAFLPAYRLVIIGNGDILNDLKNEVSCLLWQDRIEFIDKMIPEKLDQYTCTAKYGLNLLDASSLSYQYSLANKFFDYLQAGIPSINMDLPEYSKIIQKEKVGLLLTSLNARHLAIVIEENDKEGAYQKMKDNCLIIRNKYIWEVEEPKLLKLFEGLKK